MSGVEVAGLVLGLFPLIAQLIRSEREGDTSDLRLHESLENNKLLYRDTIETMLRSIAPAEVDALMSDFEGPGWKDASLKAKITHLGQDGGAILRSMNSIYKTLSKLSQRLSDPAADPALNLGERTRLVVRRFLHGAADSASLSRLLLRNIELRMLVDGSMRLAPSRNLPPSGSQDLLRSALNDLELIRRSACGLHDALQAGWNCNCSQSHETSIKLDDWTIDWSDAGKLKFQLLCADNVQEKHEMTAVTTPVGSVALQNNPSTINDLCTFLNPPDRSQRSRRRQGSISSSRCGRDFDIFSGSNTTNVVKTASGSSTTGDVSSSNTPRSGKLTDFLGSFTTRAQLRLALQLARAVMRISSTVWLKGKWLKDNVLVDLATPGDPLAYISDQFPSRRHSSHIPTPAPSTPEHIADWVHDVSLFALGVFILEVSHNRSIEQLATPTERKNPTLQPLLTATRLAKTARSELGKFYAEAINACLNPPFSQNAEDHSQFAKDVLRTVIKPLNAAVDAWWS